MYASRVRQSSPLQNGVRMNKSACLDVGKKKGVPKGVVFGPENKYDLTPPPRCPSGILGGCELQYRDSFAGRCL